MFLSCRATQAESSDAPGRSLAEIAKFYESLNSVNRFFVFAEPFQRMMPRLLGPAACRSLSILDLGAGDGSLGKLLAPWAAQRGWNWRFTNLDIHLLALALNRNGVNVAASALALPFRDESFEVVIASQMTHHLTDEGVLQHLREAWRVARSAIFLSDLHRNVALYGILSVLLAVRRFPDSLCMDGRLSVRRGWRVQELETLAHQAGIAGARARLYFGARVLLQARKEAASKG
jgi:ubiquinone/menaquinone biosynthesis C-methylase UbiE